MTKHDSFVAPCAKDPQSWDLDSGDLLRWRSAVITCKECPFFEDCKALRAQAHPKGVIWAGTAYSDEGNPMTTKTLLRHGRMLQNQRASRTKRAA